MRGSAGSQDVASGWGHDIRTHLNILLGAIGMIETEKLSPEKMKEYFAMIRQNALAMLRLLNHVLDAEGMCEGECQNASPTLQDLQIDGLLTGVAETIRPLADSRHLEILHDIAGPLHALCNAEALERVLYNLLSNAIKFTEPGGFVYFSAKASGETIEINVADTGCGLTPLQQRQLRGDPSQAVGHGMGLRLVKTLVASMAGSLSCTSREHVGTTFYLRLPSSDARRQGYQSIAAHSL